MEKKAIIYLETPLNCHKHAEIKEEPKNQSLLTELLDISYNIPGEIEIEEELKKISEWWKYCKKSK